MLLVLMINSKLYNKLGNIINIIKSLKYILICYIILILYLVMNVWVRPYQKKNLLLKSNLLSKEILRKYMQILAPQIKSKEIP